MGNICISDNSEEATKSKAIASSLSKDKKEMKAELKLLLLGAGESGKSTIFKQMKIIHKNGYDAKECTRFKEIIFGNVLQSIRVLINAMGRFELDYETDEVRGFAEEVSRISEQQIILNASSMFTPEMAGKIKKIWQDKGIRQAFEQKSQLQLNDSASYYLNDLDRISVPEYVPTQQDVLRSRVKTVGIVEMEFAIKNYKFKMVDVGGQRNERRKWIHCFDDVTAIIFVASLSEYDQVLFEDDSVNRMRESLTLFEEICSCRYFRNTSIIIFFNKEDLFKEKIKKIDLKVAFDNYQGGCDYTKAIKYIQDQFESASKKGAKGSKRIIIGKVTCATDTTNIKTVFDGVKSIILRQNIDEVGL